MLYPIATGLHRMVALAGSRSDAFRVSWAAGPIHRLGPRRVEGSLLRGEDAHDHNDFALALYGQLLRGASNLFISPFSIRMALAMAFAGARGVTAAQMSKALRLPSSIETLPPGFAKLARRLEAADGATYELAMPNSLWAQEGAPLQTTFLKLVSRHYRGELYLVDFRRSSDPSRLAINGWVESKTKGRITDVIQVGGVTTDTRMVVVNAVYFKGRWALEFDEVATTDAPFYLEGGGHVRAPLMSQQEEVRYLRAEGFQVVELDYQGSDLSLLVLLPDEKDGLRDLETRLSAHTLDAIVARMVSREVEVFLPRLRLTCAPSPSHLEDGLRALGMSLAFTDEADFSGINGHQPPDPEALRLFAVHHKAFVEVNEQGTEAAAATAIVLEAILSARARPPVPVFRVDHPFLFAIRDRESGAILFLGRVADPTRDS
jgi:serine protease inhibitor